MKNLVKSLQLLLIYSFLLLFASLNLKSQSYTQPVDITTDVDAVLKFINNDGSWQYIEFITETGGTQTRKAYMGIDWDGDLAFRTENGGDFHFTQGNVGIGVTNPSELLHVQFNDAASGTENTIFNLEYLASDNKGAAQMRIHTGGNANGTTIIEQIGSGGLNGTDFNDFNIKQQYGGTSEFGNIGFFTGGSERLTIIGGTGATAGNVGIGTTTPSARLDVEGSIRSLSNQTSGTLSFYSAQQATASLTLRYTPVAIGGIPKDVWQYRIGGSGRDIAFSYFDQEAVLFMDMGNRNVGIGTTGPAAKLDIAKDDGANTINLLRLVNANSTYSQSVQFSLDSNKDLIVAGASGAGGLEFNMGSNGYRFLGGNVGIGTTTPTDRLQIGTDTESSLNLRIGSYASLGVLGGGWGTVIGNNVKASTTSNNTMEVLKNASVEGARAISMRYSEGITFHTYYGALTAGQAFSGYERMRIDNDGNVGIGITNPLTRLHLYQTNSVSRTSVTDLLTLESSSSQSSGYNGFGTGIAFFGRTYQNSTKRVLSRIASIQRGDSGNDLGNALLFETIATSSGNGAPTERMRIEYNGNVGIGTNDPGTYKLAVEGQIGARSIKVTQATWADYVFAPSYQLMPLSEVETYIAQNQHLPNVPSAKEVEENGFVLEEMDAKLMEKIEELTLYMIEQQKQNTQQNHIIKKQEEQIESLQKQLEKLIK